MGVTTCQKTISQIQSKGERKTEIVELSSGDVLVPSHRHRMTSDDSSQMLEVLTSGSGSSQISEIGCCVWNHCHLDVVFIMHSHWWEFHTFTQCACSLHASGVFHFAMQPDAMLSSADMWSCGEQFIPPQIWFGSCDICQAHGLECGLHDCDGCFCHRWFQQQFF